MNIRDPVTGVILCPSRRVWRALCPKNRPPRALAATGLRVWIALLLANVAHAQPSLSLDQQRIALYQRWAIQNNRAAVDHNGQSGGPAAESVPTYFDPSRQYFFVPEALAGFPASDDSTDAAKPPPSKADSEQAAALFTLAQEALRQDQGSLAYQLAHEVLQFDPEHGAARHWLGLPAAAGDSPPPINVRPGRRPHPRLGWPAGAYLHVATPHFQITTNDPEETALRLARVLEELHVVWEQMFFDCWGHSAVLRARDTGRGTRRRRARHQVVMFHQREEYEQYIRSVEPQAELTRGYYHAPSRTAYFIGGDTPLESTWRHEATHQLFHENTPTVGKIGDQQNFWIIEGVALYMESMQRCRQWHTVGGLEAERLQYARFRALREGYYLPLESLVAFDQATLQHHEQIRQIYSQAAGLTHFLMDGQQGRYRSATQRYLQDVYRHRDRPDSLIGATQSTWPELDQQYHEFLQVDDPQLQRLDRDAQIRQLCLGGTAITDAGLLSLPSLQRVTWLDLYGTKLTDRGTQPLREARQLEQLSLEGTGVSDATIARLETAAGLKQLDLSGTQITDKALETIGGLTRLESLWLANTRVTDAGLRYLANLKRLRVLDLTGTRSTPAGRAELESALPDLSAN